jgi:nitroreductase
MLRDLIIKNRSYRRFDESVLIGTPMLTGWLDLARYAASGRNIQPLKYILSNTSEKNQFVFETLAWAAYLTEWKGPEEGERPTAYIIQLLDKTIADHCFCDDGIAAQNILLGAVNDGFGGCIFRSINKKKLMGSLNIPNHLEIINVIALGKPIETVVIETMVDNQFKYWRDENGTHHVPKRPLDEILLS